MTQRSFLPPVIDLQQALESESYGGDGNNSITRRQFIKRSGGATVATLVAFSLSNRAEARVGPPYSSSSSSWGFEDVWCEWIRCVSDPTVWNGTTSSPIVGNVQVVVQWKLAGAVTGQTAAIPLPLPMALGASVTVIQHTSGGVKLTIDQMPFKNIDQGASCTPQCARIYNPPYANGSWLSASGDTTLNLKLYNGNVVQIFAIHGPSGAKVSVPVTGLNWTFICE